MSSFCPLHLFRNRIVSLVGTSVGMRGVSAWGCCDCLRGCLWRCMVCNVFWGVSQSTTRVRQDILFKFLVCDDDQLMVMMWAITNFDRKKYFDGAFTFQNLMKISFLTDNPLIQLFSWCISPPCVNSQVLSLRFKISQTVSVYERSILLKKDVNSNSFKSKTSSIDKNDRPGDDGTLRSV